MKLNGSASVLLVVSEILMSCLQSEAWWRIDRREVVFFSRVEPYAMRKDEQMWSCLSGR